jgi:AraC family transcriptional regulator, transcriptional activator of pobA
MPALRLLNQKSKTQKSLRALRSRESLDRKAGTGDAKSHIYFSDKTEREIACELGFDAAARFSRFFKNQTGENPSKLKKSPRKI